MSSPLIVTGLILIPAFLLIADDISWEKLSIKSIKRVGDRSDVRSKLIELGFYSENNYENFRYRQLIISSMLSFTIMLVVTFAQVKLAAASILIFSSIVVVIYWTEEKLSQKVKKHREGIESEFPAIIEALTLALSAGETPLSAMQRISSRGSGSLASEFLKVIAAVNQGEPFAHSLDSMGRRVKSLAVRKFVDSVVIAVTRGAPLIDVLHSHAREAREYQRNRVLASSAKAEISMMIPVVFLILPISILFALWPSLTNLNLFVTS